jgi:hypothetical protein
MDARGPDFVEGSPESCASGASDASCVVPDSPRGEIGEVLHRRLAVRRRLPVRPNGFLAGVFLVLALLVLVGILLDLLT